MQKIAWIVLFVCTTMTTTFAQKQIEANISDVTVFLTGAQIRHKGSVTLKKGENKLILSGLTANMDVNSIQIVGNTDYVILSVKHRFNYESKKSNARVQSIQDSLKLLAFQNAERASMRNVYNEEKSFLQTNRSIKGENTLLLKEDLAEMADFYRLRMKEIEYKLLELNQNDRESNEKISKLQQQLSQLNSQNSTNPSEIEFVLQSADEKKSEVEIAYITNGAGWTPYYDLRSEDIESDIEFTYRAKVYNSTGNDWKRVNLTLSTGNPSAGAQAPTISPWYVNFYTPQVYDKRNRSEGYRQPYLDGAPAAALEYKDEATISSKLTNGWTTTASYTTIVNSSVSVEFKIGLKYDIDSDNEPVEVVMQKQKLKANYKYVCIPKLDLSAYLQAEITDWMQYSLLPGESNIYFQGTFVGNGYIDPAMANDTLQLSLGKDAGIVVKRDQLKDFCKTGVLGGKKTITKAFEISVMNTKKKSIQMEILDQIPMSNNAEIEVVVDELSMGVQDLKTGLVTWKEKIEPESTIKRNLRFTVKYPKKQFIQNL